MKKICRFFVENNSDECVLEFLRKAGFSEKYKVIRCDCVTHPYERRNQEILELIIQKNMDDETIMIKLKKYVSHLDGAKKLVITDPYIFRKGNKINVVDVFGKLIDGIKTNLEEVKFLYPDNAKKDNEVFDGMKDILNKNKIKMTVEKCNEFHDRFWVGIDNRKGVVLGTSLNGIGKKIALVDILKESDVDAIIDELKIAGLDA